MSRKRAIYIQGGLALLMFGWVAMGATAAYVFGAYSQLSWLLLSLSMLGFSVCAAVIEVFVARYTHEISRAAAQATVESWPHVINLLDDMERIAPERAEMVHVAKLEMIDELKRARQVAAGRPPGLLDMLKGRKDES